MDLELANHLRERGIRDERVLSAIASLSRAEFMPEEMRWAAGRDTPSPIGFGQTISQPYVVAYMTQELQVEPGHRVLEVGTGSGYQTAVLASLGAQVYTVERVPQLLENARETFHRLGLTGLHLRLGDGTFGWPDEAPFDRVLVTAAAVRLPERLVDQLEAPGRLITPIGGLGQQELVQVDRSPNGELSFQKLLPVRFVPLVEDGPKPS